MVVHGGSSSEGGIAHRSPGSALGKSPTRPLFFIGLGQAGDPEIRRYFTLLRDTSGGLFTLAGDENDWLQPIDQNNGKLETDADTVLRFGSGA